MKEIKVKHILLLRVFLFLLVMLPVNQVFAQTKSQKIDKLMTFSYENGLFNGIVLVAENGSVIYKNAFGIADWKTKRQLKIDSPVYLASVSKQFTSMAVMILKEQNKLSFQDKLSDYFPDFPDYAKKVTIEHLLTHTSAIPDHFRLGRVYPDYKNKDVLEKLKGVSALNSEPGEKFSYSNSGYVLLALIVEKVSGEPFHIFLKKHIFDPLGMKNSIVYDESKPFIKNRAIGYRTPDQEDDYHILTYGAGGIYSTVEDLFKWDQALYTEKLVSAATLQKAFTPYKLNGGQISNYGYGWQIMQDNSGKTVSHGGRLAGFRTYVERQFTGKNTIIILTNVAKPNASSEIHGALKCILQDKPYRLPVPENGTSIGN